MFLTGYKRFFRYGKLNFFCSDRPEIVVNPPKVFVYTMPTQVKFNCTVNAYPDANIVWMFNNIDLREPFRQRVKKMRQAYREEKYRNKGVGSRYIKNNFNNNNVNVNVDQVHRHGRNLAQKATDTASKYRIIEHALNETSRMSSIVINVENEHDLGVYECFANNTAGSKSIKFYIYGGKFWNIPSFYFNKPKKRVSFKPKFFYFLKFQLKIFIWDIVKTCKKLHRNY